MSYDLFVIGAGSGGVRAARVAAEYGARVGIAEEYRHGGTCVIRGCIPKKLLVYASHVREDIDDAAGYGWTIGDVRFDWAALIANKERELDRLESVYQGVLERAGVARYDGRATVIDPHTVDVAGERITANVILIATGGKPTLPEIPGVEHAITSNEALSLPALPRRLAVVGGGYIGLEFAAIFRGLGVDVLHVHRGERLLRGFDRDVRDAIGEAFRHRGIDLRLGCEVTAIESTADDRRAVTLSTGEREVVDAVLMATGRAPNTADMGLLEAGVKLDWNGAVVVDDYSQSSVDSIYAVGDCTHRMELTPVAIREGQAFADTVFGGKATPMRYEAIPTAVFTQPPIATVGMTEHDAHERCDGVAIYKSEFRPLKHTLSGRQERTLMKLIVERGTDRVVGAHIVGPDAPEIIQPLAIAVNMGATKADFDATVALHPTAAEELVLMRRPVE